MAYATDQTPFPYPTDAAVDLQAMMSASQLMSQLQTTPLPPAEWANTMTVMMRNLPNKYTQHMLLEEINQMGFLGGFDFLYLPIDPETTANRGYAFINFIDPGFAWMFKLSFEGRKMNHFNSNKVVSVMPATLQGFEANYEHYSTARVNRGDAAARPLFLREPSGHHVAAPRRARGRRGNSGSAIDAASNQRQGRPQQQQQVPAAQPPPQQQPQHLPQQQPPQQLHQQPFFPRPLGGGVAGTSAAESLGSGLPAQWRYCPSCGGELQPEFQFCPVCGIGLRELAGNA